MFLAKKCDRNETDDFFKRSEWDEAPVDTCTSRIFEGSYKEEETPAVLGEELKHN